jgi:rhodanese-related sulfurtransferase
MSDENKFIEQKGLRRRLNNGELPVIVDVRTPEEFSASHIDGAINIPANGLAARAGETSA